MSVKKCSKYQKDLCITHLHVAIDEAFRGSNESASRINDVLLLNNSVL
jgi:hypothetical protein